MLTIVPYLGSCLEQLFFGSQDDKKIKELSERIKNSDNALGIKRDIKDNVTNDPFDFGTYD